MYWNIHEILVPVKSMGKLTLMFLGWKNIFLLWIKDLVLELQDNVSKCGRDYFFGKKKA